MIYEEYEAKKIYQNKDGRFRIYLAKFKQAKTISYPKYLMEIHLGRYLDDDETVDHIDEDFTNNNINNLRVLKRKIHCKNDALRNKPMSFVCPECGIEFVLFGDKLHDASCNRKKGKAGPFCGRSCAGKYGQKIQYGLEKLPAKIIELEKYKLRDEKIVDNQTV